MTNVQTPLQHSPVPLFADDEWQMSFAERAVLEGLRGQVRPQLVVEVGTASGASLRCLARGARAAHAFDLIPPPRPLAPHVTFHEGDSHHTLPAWLACAPQIPIDMALVDGDHSNTGVYEDVVALLESPRCEHTVIVVHDVAHSPVRDGVLAAIARCEQQLAYHDIDFFPGYVFTRGGFAGESWGGFALLIAGEAGTEHPQDLYRPI